MTVFKLENIKCGGCARSIIDALDKIEGISDARVNVEEGTISLNETGATALAQAKSTLLGMGYPEPGAGGITTTAKSYVSCMIGRIKQ